MPAGFGTAGIKSIRDRLSDPYGSDFSGSLKCVRKIYPRLIFFNGFQRKEQHAIATILGLNHPYGMFSI